MMEKTMLEATLAGATEPGSRLTEHDAAAALNALRKPTEPAKPPAEPVPDAEPPADAPTEPVETEDEPQSQDAQDPNPDEATETEQVAVDLPAVAKALGLNADDLILSEDGTVSIKTKVDGQDGTVKPADLRKSYQLESSFTHKSMQLAEERKQFERAKHAEVQTIAQKRQEAEMALNVAARFLYGQYPQSEAEWAKLHEQDPIGYLSLKDQFEQHQRMLQSAYGALQKGDQEKLQQQQAQYQEWGKQQAIDLVNHIPEWKNPDVAKAALDGIFSTAKADYGVTQPELDQLLDSRYIRILRDATAYRKLMAQKTGVMKKVSQAPVIAKPGTGAKPSKNNEQQIRERFRADPSERNAAAALSLLRKRK